MPIQIDAFDFVARMVERGEIADDDVLVEGNAVYIIEKETYECST